MIKSKGEEELYKILRSTFGYTKVKRNYHIGERLSLDIYLPSYGIGIEYDGIQHFERVEHFHKTHKDFLDQQARDRRKDELCDELGISLLRIRYDEDIDSAAIIEFILGNVKQTVPTAKKKRVKTKWNKPTPEMKKKQRDYRKMLYRKAKKKYKL